MRLSTLSRSVQGARVIVTGAGSGMGRATAHLFADEGAKVLVADRNPATVQLVVDEIVAAHGRDSVVGCSGDVSNPSDRQEIVRTIVEAWGGIDVLVNNAGVSLVSSVFSDDETFLSNWDQTVAINVTAHAHMIRACLSYLLKAPQGGRIVNIASTEAIVATGGISAYTASKHAVIGLTKSFAVELGRHNVTVNAICPGWVETALIEPQIQAKVALHNGNRAAGIADLLAEKQPSRRMSTPEEIGAIAVFLCSPAAHNITGASIPVDGGWTAQ